MSNLTELPNIGKELSKKLESIGIHSAEKLKQTGSKATYLKLNNKCSNVCLVHLYCLQGAIDSREYNNLPKDIKADLKTFSDSLKEVWNIQVI